VERVLSVAMRLLFIVAFILFAVAVVEALANAFGYTITRGTYSGGRLLEFAVVFSVLVVTLLLRQIRDQLKRDTGGRS
jgi:hypothetical protein